MTVLFSLLIFSGGLVLGAGLLLWLSDSLDPLNGPRKPYHGID